MTRRSGGLFSDPRPVEKLADLLANVWQLGYVTTDLDRAMEVMAGQFGLTRCVKLPAGGATFLSGEEPAPWEARFAMGARGGLIVELIEPLAGEVAFYRRVLPADGSFAIRFHHVATFVPTGDDEWERLRGILARAGLRYDYTVLIPDRVRAGYVDTSAQLGHMIEICQLQREDIDFFEELARPGDG
jgi:hypothetical protein